MARRVLAIIAAGVLATSALAGCTALSPVKTQKSYAASDGVRAQFDNLRVENLMILTAEAGAPAQVYGTLVNNSDQDATFTVQLGDAVVIEQRVSAQSQVTLPTDESEAVRGDFQPGAMVDGVVKVDGGMEDVAVPVLDGTIPPYDEYLP
ncbi:MAG: hypothetical protein Q4Q03_06670 [Bowdeniella nasicola]|nr:hypothetical protein [Bowdeniella nasicola]